MGAGKTRPAPGTCALSQDPSTRLFDCTLRARSGAPVQQLVLEMPAAFRFRAGQYLEVLHPQGSIPLSIASGPRRLPELHLHYRSTPGAPEAAWMDELLAAQNPLRVRGPSGAVLLPDAGDVPLLLIAGGTGITQVCAILDDLAGASARAPVTVLWCADSAADLYCRTELEALHADWLSIECVTDARRDAGNAGLQRIAELAAKAAAPNDSATRASWILLAGSPGFVYTALDLITEQGIEPARVHSDVFAYAPRPSPPARDRR